MLKPLLIMLGMAGIFMALLISFAITGLKNQNSPESAVNLAAASATAAYHAPAVTPSPVAVSPQATAQP